MAETGFGIFGLPWSGQDQENYSFKKEDLTPETSCLWICSTEKYFVLPLELIEEARNNGWPDTWASTAMHKGHIRMRDCPFMPRWVCNTDKNDVCTIERL